MVIASLTRLRHLDTRCLLVAYGATLLLLFAHPVHAGNEDEILLGNDAALMGGAITATTADGSALWYNPAGLAATRLDAVDVSANAFTARWVRIDRYLQTSGSLAAAGNYTELLVVPSALTYVRSLGKKLSLGLGVFVPRYHQVQLKARLTSEATPPTDWLLAGRDVLTRYHLCAGLGWRILPVLQLGATFAIVYETDSQSVQFTGTQVATDNPDFLTVSNLVTRQSFGFEFRLGTQWQIHPRWRLGVAASTPRVSFANNVDSAATSAISQNVGSTGGESVVSIDDQAGLGYGVEVLAPLRLRAGLAYLREALTLSVDGDVQLGLSNEALSFEHAPTWNVRVGGQYALSERWRLGLGLFTDRSTTANEDDLDIDFWGFSGGVQYTNKRDLAKHEKQHRIYFSTTVALRYAFGSGTIQGLVVPADLQSGTLFDFAPVDASAQELTLHVGSALYF